MGRAASSCSQAASGNHRQIVEFARAAQPLPAVNHHAFAIDVFGHVADQEDREIGEFVVFAEALHRMLLEGILFVLLGRNQPRPRAFGGERSGRDRVHADVIFGPFHRERSGHRQDARLGASGRHNVTRATICRGVGRGNIQDIAAEFFGDTPPGEGLGAMKSAVEDDADNRLKGIWRQLFRAGHEVSGGVIHQRIDLAPVILGGGHSGLDGVVFPDVAGGVSGRAAIAVNLFAGLFEGFFAASDQEEPRPKLGEVQGHGAAKASATAGQEDGAAFEEIGLKHRAPPFGTRLYQAAENAQRQLGRRERCEWMETLRSKQRRGGDLVPPRLQARQRFPAIRNYAVE